LKAVVGTFESRTEALRAREGLRRAGIAEDRLNLLWPGSTEAEVHATVRTEDTEQPGMGKAVGGVVGGVIGATSGMGLGAAAASLLLPGVGAVAAAELAAGALLGAGGAVGGAVAGGALESQMSHGLPKDELYLYEDALRHGRSVLFVLTEDEAEAERARSVLAGEGAETLDAAREKWWVGVRDAERVHYEKEGGDFGADEPAYRGGFEAALHPRVRGRTYAEAEEFLRARHPKLHAHAAFRRGFERGRAHLNDSSQAPAETAGKSKAK
jgi:outer membrane lipoprotein SlyB